MVYPITRHILFRFVRFFIKKTVGLEHVPLTGPYIIACKHFGSLDGVFIAAVIIPKINRKIHYVSNVAQWGWFWEKVVAERWSGCIPFYKDNPKICLDIALDYLKKGKIVGIFPEGILQDRKLNEHRAKTGVARLAIWAKVPVVPVGLKHNVIAREDLPKLHRRRQVIKNILLNPHSMEIHIGKPFELTEYYDKKMDKGLLVEATNKVMNRIEALTSINIKNI